MYGTNDTYHIFLVNLMKPSNESHAVISEANKSDSQLVFGKVDHDLDNVVKVWSDFLRVYLHPKTIQIIEQYYHLKYVLHIDVFKITAANLPCVTALILNGTCILLA